MVGSTARLATLVLVTLTCFNNGGCHQQQLAEAKVSTHHCSDKEMINSIENLDHNPPKRRKVTEQYLTHKEMLTAMEDFERKEAENNHSESTKDEEKYLLLMKGNIMKDFSGSDKILLVQQANCCAVKLKNGGLADALSQVLPLRNPNLLRSPGFHKANLASEVTHDKFGSIKFVNNGKK
nr:uncharacterized protein LOC128692916 [Cherax quadricarinatus]